MKITSALLRSLGALEERPEQWKIATSRFSILLVRDTEDMHGWDDVNGWWLHVDNKPRYVISVSDLLAVIYEMGDEDGFQRGRNAMEQQT